ncbi:MAG: hypothetical protein WCJ74_02955 [bacterium]
MKDLDGHIISDATMNDVSKAETSSWKAVIACSIMFGPFIAFVIYSMFFNTQ